MQKLVRGLFIGFNILFCIIGVIFIGVGSYVIHKGKTSNLNDLLGFLGEEVQDGSTVSPTTLTDALAVEGALLAVGGFLITIGLATFFISTCGWLGACKQNTCLLFAFSVVMIIVVFIELVLGIVAAVTIHKINGPTGDLTYEVTQSLMSSGYQAYWGSENDTQELEGLKNAFDVAQKTGECCGINSYEDWTNKTLVGEDNTKYPNSCYPDEDQNNKINEEGCWKTVKQFLGRMSGAMAGTAITFCILEIFGIVISCYLACTMKRSGQYEQH